MPEGDSMEYAAAVKLKINELFVNRNPNGGCNVPKVAKFLDE